jgi:hypothetical protein
MVNGEIETDECCFHATVFVGGAPMHPFGAHARTAAFVSPKCTEIGHANLLCIVVKLSSIQRVSIIFTPWFMEHEFAPRQCCTAVLTALQIAVEKLVLYLSRCTMWVWLTLIVSICFYVSTQITFNLLISVN